MKEKVAAPISKTEITAIRIYHADHMAPSIRKKERERERYGTNFPTSGGRSVGIVRSRTQAKEFLIHIM
jgi:hypothetical protein